MTAFVNVEADVLSQMMTNTGESICRMSNRQPIMLIFLRHFGCTFCREALSDIAKRRKDIESTGAKIVFVHMADVETAERYFSRYNLEGSTHISDPECRYYMAFGLVKGNFHQLFGLHFFIRGFQSAVLEGHGTGKLIGDGFQMPGVFVIQEGEIKESFVHKLVSDRPDYIELAKCCAIA
ncbi:MAG: SelL-related redox protein [Saprospiraceae bacterium]|nr:SelL-related redox protein [Saprospiraceae bacterium]